MFSTLKSNQSAVLADEIARGTVNSISSGFARGAKKGALIGGGLIAAGLGAGLYMRRPMPGRPGSREFNDAMQTEMDKRGIKYQ